MKERFNAKISANISDFLRKMSQVDKKIKETAFECTKPIDADVKKAITKMENVNKKAKEIAKETTKDVDANVSKAVSKLDEVNKKAREVTRKETKPIDVSIEKAKRKLDEIKALATQWSKDHIKKPVTLDLSGYKRKMAELKATETDARKKVEVSVHADTKSFSAKLKALLAKPKNYYVNVRARTALFKAEIAKLKSREVGKEIFLQIRARNERFYRDLDNIAESIRSWGVVLGNILKGTFIAVIPSIAAFGAAATGALATIGVMAGVATGGLIGLASAFAVAGAAVGVFAITAIGQLKDFKKFMEGKGPGTKEMMALRDEVNGLKDDHKKLSDELASNNFETFTNGVKTARKVLSKLHTMIVDSSRVMKDLSKSLNESMDSAPMERFFNYLNQNGASTLERVSKGVGFFGRSLASLMVAFGPLADSMSKGFLDMSKRIDEWSYKLADSKGMQQFTNYVNANMPKIRGAFRDLVVAIVNMFAAFGPMAAKAMSWFEKLMARFREWTSQLGQNKAFQSFVEYIEEAAPKVGQLIGNISKTIALLAKGMAPLALSIVNVANSFLQWFNALMQTNPGVAQTIAKIITLSGVALALVPALTLIRSWFSDVGDVITEVSTVFRNLGLSMMGVVTTIAVVVAAFVHLYNTNQTTHNLMKSIWENIKQLFITFGQIAMLVVGGVVTILGRLVDALAPVINAVLFVVDGFLTWMNQTLQNNKWLQVLIATVLAGVLAFKIITTVLTTLKIAFTLVTGAIGTAKAGIVAFASTSTIVSTAGSIITGVLTAIRTGFLMLMGPWGVVAAALIGGLVILYNKFEWFRNLVDKVFTAVGNAFKWVAEKVGKALEWLGLKSEESSNKVSSSMDTMNQKAQTASNSAATAMEQNGQRISTAGTNAGVGLDNLGLSLSNLDMNAQLHSTSAANSIMTNTSLASQNAITNMTNMNTLSSQQLAQLSGNAELNMAALNTSATTNTSMASQNAFTNLSNMNTLGSQQLSQLASAANTQFGAVNSAASTQTSLMSGTVGSNLSQVNAEAQTSLNNVNSLNTRTWENVAQTANTQTNNLVKGVLQNFKDMNDQIKNAMQSVVNSVNQGCADIQRATNQSFSNISSNIQQETSNVQNVVRNSMSNINSVTSEGLSQLENNTQRSGQNVVNIVRDTGEQAVSTLRSFYGHFSSCGAYLMDGFVEGMWSRSGSVMATAQSIANAAANAISSALQIHSPSRVVAKITRWVPMGMVEGMKDTASKAIGYASNMASKVANAINYAVNPVSLKSDINDIGINRRDVISSEVKAEYDFTKQPVQLNIQLGNRAFGTFVEDINEVNSNTIQLNEVYSM